MSPDSTDETSSWCEERDETASHDPFEVALGYLDAFERAAPAANPSLSYLHGWLMGRDKLRRARDKAAED